MPGLRERKKAATRRALSEVAFSLFTARGFDHVTVAEVAAAADVAPATVFNYFRTKEDLFFDREAELREQLLAALPEDLDGRALLDGFRGWHQETLRFLFEPRAVGRVRTFTRILLDSPALLEREQAIRARDQAALADHLLRHGWADPYAPLVAGQLLAAHTSVVDYGRRVLLDPRAAQDTDRQVCAASDLALRLLTATITQQVGGKTADRVIGVGNEE